MASSSLAVFLAIVAVALPALARATEHVVGDDQGWTFGFNYTTWAQDKEFRVGDTLVFIYTPGNHNVFKVGGPQFRACIIPPENQALTSGHDVIALTTAGRKWYICGKGDGNHCAMGQKLVITVLPAEDDDDCGDAPSPAPAVGAELLSVFTPAPSPEDCGDVAPSPAAAVFAPAPSPDDCGEVDPFPDVVFAPAPSPDDCGDVAPFPAAVPAPAPLAWSRGI